MVCELLGGSQESQNPKDSLYIFLSSVANIRSQKKGTTSGLGGSATAWKVIEFKKLKQNIDIDVYFSAGLTIVDTTIPEMDLEKAELFYRGSCATYGTTKVAETAIRFTLLNSTTIRAERNTNQNNVYAYSTVVEHG